MAVLSAVASNEIGNVNRKGPTLSWLWPLVAAHLCFSMNLQFFYYLFSFFFLFFVCAADGAREFRKKKTFDRSNQCGSGRHVFFVFVLNILLLSFSCSLAAFKFDSRSYRSAMS